MNQDERLDYLVEAFKEDSVEYKNMQVPKAERTRILRSLMNIRMPKPISEELRWIQDAYLQEEAKDKGIVTLEEIPAVKTKYGSTHSFADKISIWQGDITRLAVDGIVNAANSQMLGCFVPMHRCIDNAIHSAASVELREACNCYMTRKRREIPRYEEPTGQAMVTDGFNLPAKHVIHTVGPIVGWKLNDDLRQELRDCYKNCMKAAVEYDIRSIAFCCISTGEFHFPNEEAAAIAVETVSGFLEANGAQFDRVIFNVFKEVDKEQYERLLK